MTRRLNHAILPPEPDHACDLPEARSGYGSTGMPEGTIVQCWGCRRWYVCVPCYAHYGPTTVWAKVRWYHRAAHRRIKALEEAERPLREEIAREYREAMDEAMEPFLWGDGQGGVVPPEERNR